MNVSFLTVTELAGDKISQEQLDRMHHRYQWAAHHCENKDVLEVACGTGPGLGMLLSVSSNLDAGDFDNDILEIAQSHYGNRLKLMQFDGTAMPYPDNSKDIIILFEALYYIPDAQLFFEECSRVLRPGGTVLLSTANKDLIDFNPSPNSHKYYGVRELDQILLANGFSSKFFGYKAINDFSFKQRLLRWVKKTVVSFGLMPKTMAGKKLLKRIVFGRLVTMPRELDPEHFVFNKPTRLDKRVIDCRHKVIYCCAKQGGGT